MYTLIHEEEIERLSLNSIKKHVPYIL